MKELLDEDIAPENMINIVHGKLAPPAISYASYLIIIFGVFFLVTLNIFLMIIGLGFTFIGVFAAFSKYGILLDLENKKYKLYKGLLGFNQGKWNSLNDYPDLTVLRVNMKSSVSTRYGGASISTESYYYNICLLNKSHRSKILIESTQDKDQAYENVKKYAKLLGVNIAKFSPTISEKTRLRKEARNKTRRR